MVLENWYQNLCSQFKFSHGGYAQFGEITIGVAIAESTDKILESMHPVCRRWR
jgi:hypothetical protein